MAQNPDSVEITGKTVDDAVQRALRRLGLNRSQVDVEVLAEGRAGIFGIGATEASVRVSARGGRPAAPRREPLPKIDDYEAFEEVERQPAGLEASRRGGRPGRGDRSRGGRPGGGRGGGGGRGREREREEERAPLLFDLLADPEFEPNEDPVQFATELLMDIVRLMGFGAAVTAREPETPMDGLGHAKAVLDVRRGDEDTDLQPLIGPDGVTIAALQYVINVIVSRSVEGQNAITVDVDGYRRERERELQAMAQEAAAEVRETHQPVALDPMPAAERRIIHLALQDDAEIATESAGEGRARRVQVVYRTS